MKAKRFIGALLIFTMCIGLVSASAEEVYPETVQSIETETELETELETETETETEVEAVPDMDSVPETESVTERQETKEQLIRTFEESFSGIALLSGDLQICLGYPDNRYFTGTASSEGGVHWKNASPTENLNSPSNWWWLMYGWYDTYGSACYYNADGSPNNGPTDFHF